MEVDLFPIRNYEIEIDTSDETRIRRPEVETITLDPPTITFRNETSETIPPFAALQPNGILDNTKPRTIIKVIKPNSDPPYTYYLNGPRPVKAGGYGQCANLPAFGAWGPEFDVSATQIVGPRPGKWQLYNQQSGFVTLGPSADGRVLVAGAPPTSFGALYGSASYVPPAGHTRLQALNTAHPNRCGVTVNEADYSITVDRDGGYHVSFVASVKYDTWTGASPIMALWRNDSSFLGPSVGTQFVVWNSHYGTGGFNGIVRLNAGDVLHVRMFSVAELIHFKYAMFTVHLVAVA